MLSSSINVAVLFLSFFYNPAEPKSHVMQPKTGAAFFPVGSGVSESVASERSVSPAVTPKSSHEFNRPAPLTRARISGPVFKTLWHQ